jgi:hypothetical protein
MAVRTLVVALTIVSLYASAAAVEQPAPLLPGQGIKGCAIPKEFGKLVTYIAGEDAGIRGQVTSRSANGNVLAGQAIFEAQDGTIRWVAVVAPAGIAGEKPALRIMPRNFPVMPIYDCALANVWERR